MVSSMLDPPIAPFSSILVMVMRFRLPIINTEVTQDISNFIGNCSLSTIRYEQIHSTSFANIIHKYSGKIAICMDAINVTEMRFSTTEELGCK